MCSRSAASASSRITGAARCEAGYDQESDSNPGKADAAQLVGFGDRSVLVGVAGANGETEGTFTVSIWLNDADVDE
jgi:hypothetical protein